MAKIDLTAEALRELFHYNQSTGIFTRILRKSNAMAGDEAGCPGNNGHLQIMVNRVLYNAHRLAWLYVHGSWPVNQIDHINGNRSDNRICNLRDIPCAANSQNQRLPHKNNKSGYLGVDFSNGKWRAQIRVSGIKRYLGIFDSPELAHAAYIQAKRELHPFNTL